MISKRAALCLGLVAAVALAAPRARALEGPTAPSGSPRAPEGPTAPSGSPRAPIVEIVLTGDADHLATIRTALESEALSAFTVRVRTAPRFDAAALFSTRASSGVTLSCWIDLSDPRRAALYFTDPVADRFLVRSIELSGRFDELDRESVAQVVELSLRSLREGARSSLDRAQARALLLRDAGLWDAGLRDAGLRDAGPRDGAAPRERPAGAPVPASGSRRALELGVFYGVMAHSDELGWTHGPGLRVALGGSWGRQRLAIGARFQYQLERRYEEPRIGLELSAVALRADASWLLSLGPGATSPELGARLGAGIDHVTATPRPGSAEDPGFVPTGARAANALVFAAGVVAKVPLTGDICLFTELVLELDPARVHYALALEQGTETVLTRHRLRPGALLGIEL